MMPASLPLTPRCFCRCSLQSRAAQATRRVILSRIHGPKHTQCSDRNCSCHVCAGRKSLQLRREAQHCKLPKTAEKITIFSWPFQVSVKVRDGKSTKAARCFYQRVNMTRKGIICLVIIESLLYVCVYSVGLAVRLRLRSSVTKDCVHMCACVCIQCANKEQAVLSHIL